MPRAARAKAPEFIYHVMCRSISEFNLFRDEDDKHYYLGLLKKYTGKFQCKIYAYCLMDSHLHMHLDPKGYDISKFMHCVNLSYVAYYNRKYKRHGHVLQGRFESRVISSDAYNLAVSAYIHNNAKDVEGYNGRVHLYPFSSMGIYLGIRKDTLGLIDTGFILKQFDIGDIIKAAVRYNEFVTKQREEASDKSIAKCLARFAVHMYRNERVILLRDYKPSKLIGYISEKLGLISIECIRIKYKRSVLKFRSFCAFTLRTLCGLSFKKICESLSNISLSGCARLCNKGYELFCEDARYKKLFEDITRTALMV